MRSLEMTRCNQVVGIGRDGDPVKRTPNQLRGIKTTHVLDFAVQELQETPRNTPRGTKMTRVLDSATLELNRQS